MSLFLFRCVCLCACCMQMMRALQACKHAGPLQLDAAPACCHATHAVAHILMCGVKPRAAQLLALLSNTSAFVVLAPYPAAARMTTCGRRRRAPWWRSSLQRQAGSQTLRANTMACLAVTAGARSRCQTLALCCGAAVQRGAYQRAGRTCRGHLHAVHAFNGSSLIALHWSFTCPDFKGFISRSGAAGSRRGRLFAQRGLGRPGELDRTIVPV